MSRETYCAVADKSSRRSRSTHQVSNWSRGPPSSLAGAPLATGGRQGRTVVSEHLGVPKTHRGYYHVSLFAGLHAIGSQPVEVKGELGRFDLKILPRRQSVQTHAQRAALQPDQRGLIA